MSKTGSNNSENSFKYAVGIEDLFWVEATNEPEAIENARDTLAALDEQDIRNLDLNVLDVEE